MFSRVYTGNSEKPYCYQVNYHLKFDDSLYSKMKQTIRSEDEQESKKKQKKQQYKKKHSNEKKVYINFDMYQANNGPYVLSGGPLIFTFSFFSQYVLRVYWLV